MANIIPFKGIRPTEDKVHLVASRPVDSYSVSDLHEKLSGNPFTFLHIINPDFDDGVKTEPGSLKRLKKIKSKYLEFIKEGVFSRDSKPSYYIYQQKKGTNTYTGIIGCSSIDDYFNGIIKVHEQTITDRENKLKEYLEVCDFNAEPVLFSYPNDKIIDNLTNKKTSTEPIYNFTTTDKVNHKLWIVNNKNEVNTIKKRFSGISSIYIADGHHRSASSALLGKSKRKKNKNFSGNEPYNYYLGVFFPETQLKIYDFNRVVKDLNGLSKEEFSKKLKDKFIVVKKGKENYKPNKKHNLGMYLDGIWYSLDAKKEIIHNNEAVGSLDASILTEHILAPILNIKDLKTDKRIGFVPGIKGMQELKNKVDNNTYKVAFALYPVKMKQLKHIADTNNIMPPKTTWVEPKMRSGLVIYSLSE